MAHPYSRGKRINSNWDADEKYAIAAEALRRMKEDVSLSRIEALRSGVLVLDKSRQKEIPDMAHAKWAPPLWEKIAAELDAANAELPAPASPTAQLADEVAEADSEDVVGESAVRKLDPVPKRRGMTKGTKIVRWNDGERRIVAKTFLKLKADFPDMKDVECLRKAVEYNASTVRQRHIAGMEAWLPQKLEEVRAEVEAEIAEAHAKADARLRAEQQAIDEAKEREAREQEEAEHIEMEKQQAVGRAVDEYKASVSIEDLLLLVAKRAAGVMIGSLVETLQTQVLAQLTGAARAPMTLHMPGGPPITLEKTEAPAPPAPRDRKPRVLVCGLIGQQEQDLRRAFDDVFDLSFVKSTGEGGGPKFRDRCHNKDLVVSMVGFGGHDIEDGAKRAGVHLKRIPGSISALKRWLSDWLSGDTARAA